MSEEQLKSFLEKVKSDTSLQEKLKGDADVDAVIDIAKEAGFTVSGDEIKAAQPQVELSDEDLRGVAGGEQTPGGIRSLSLADEDLSV